MERFIKLIKYIMHYHLERRTEMSKWEYKVSINKYKDCVECEYVININADTVHNSWKIFLKRLNNHMLHDFNILTPTATSFNTFIELRKEE